MPFESIITGNICVSSAGKGQACLSKYSMQELSMLGIYSNFTIQRQKVINSQAN